jgi:hypothetical protein
VRKNVNCSGPVDEFGNEQPSLFIYLFHFTSIGSPNSIYGNIYTSDGWGDECIFIGCESDYYSVCFIIVNFFFF